MVIDFTTFHHRTEATFHPTEPPDRAPDFVSASHSVYWDLTTHVVRASDHWVGLDGCDGQATCRWDLHNDPGGPGFRVGVCRYDAFTRRTPTLHLIDPQDRDTALAVWLMDQGGAVPPEAWHNAGLGPLPAWVRKVPKDSIAATPEAAALFARQPHLTWAVCAPLRSLRAALERSPIPWF